jgi:glutathione synthase/RimK-type ligase-like ATP-grasp enzyme
LCFFQEYIEKKYEIRLTIMGNTYIPVRINSQEREETRVDWRNGDQVLAYDGVRLPEEFVTKVHRLMHRLGLVYGAIDLIVTPDDDIVFLEVNPTGQYAWLEFDLGLPMAESMAELLLTGKFERGPVRQITCE